MLLEIQRLKRAGFLAAAAAETANQLISNHLHQFSTRKQNTAQRVYNEKKAKTEIINIIQAFIMRTNSVR